MLPTERPAVVYKIVNTVNGHFYIGVTVDLGKRKAFHLWTAKCPKRSRAPIYKALRKYGPDSFEWVVVAEFALGSDAVAEEVRLIAALQPHYNATPGGQGFSPREWTAEMRAKISRANKGRQPRLGKTHTDDTKQRLRDHGLKNRAEWLERSHLGPAARAKRVICLDDGHVYESIGAAAAAYGAARSAVAEVCLRRRCRHKAAGRVFRFEDDAAS